MWKKTKRKLADLIRSASFTEVGVALDYSANWQTREARRFGTAERDEKGDLTIEKREISSDPTALNLKFVSETENTPLSNEAKF